MTTTINNEHKKLNVPNLRFPEFSEEWEKCIIKDYGEVVTGNTPPTSKAEYYNNASFLWASPADLGINKYITDTKTKLSSLGFKKTRSIPKGSVLVTCIGSTIGKMGMAVENMSTNQQINSIVVNEKANTDFVYYAVCRAFPRYLSEVGVQAVPILSKTNFEKLPNYTTGRKEQNKIGNFLNLLDERIATQNKIIDKLQSLIKGLNDSLYQQYGNEIKISFARLGQSYSGLSGKSADDFGTGKPFITYLNVYANNVVNEKEYQYVRINEDEKQNIVQNGDVLFTLSSETPEEVGIGSVYLGNDEVYLNSFCFGIHITNKELAYSPYISYYVSSTTFRKFIYPFAQGSTRFNLCKADFEKADINLPSLDNQKHICAVLSAVTNKIEVERAMLKHYSIEKRYLLRQMFI